MSASFFTKPRLFCPGPTPVPQLVESALLETDVYHRTPDFYASVRHCRQLLAPFFGCSQEPLLLTASGTGAMEAAMTNLTAVGDSVVTVNCGKFGERWSKLARQFECQVEELLVPWGEIPSLEEILGAVAKPKSPRAIFFHANETSTGVAFPIAAWAAAIRRAAPDCLLVVDAISAMVAHEIKMNEWGLDCVIAGSQKGFGIPPGLAFIGLSERAWSQLSERPRFYFDLARERKEQESGSTAWTPATTLILALEKALVSLAAIGPAACAAHHHRLAEACRAAGRALGLELLAGEYPSNALTAIVLPPNVAGEHMLKLIQRRFGAVIAGGQDKYKGRLVRLAHLGHTDELDLIAGLVALEFGLRDQSHVFTLGQGVSAAMASLARSM